jgi:predicted ATPase
VGKSNLFDAIRFLSALADRRLIDAALSVRDESGLNTDVRSLFHRVGDEYASTMSFEVEMIVPQSGFDDLGQQAKASNTFLRYSIDLAYRTDERHRSLGSIEILKEELVHITKGDASKNLLFPHDAAEWRDSAVTAKRRVPFFISTEGEGESRYIKLHQDRGGEDRGGRGRPSSFLAANLPRTVLSASNAAESPTALLARREMQSWRLLQLEPSSLRKPDRFTAPVRLGNDGSHLPATLYHLAWHNSTRHINGATDEDAAAGVYAEVANRLSELIQDVRNVDVERDERRELLTLYVTGRDKTAHPAHALSDGTLRFLALAVLERDPEAQGLLCLEEPENGIHPERIPAILKLLQDIATDVNEPVGSDNPLRQVIINTHSPAVVLQVPEGSLLVAVLSQTMRAGREYPQVRFHCLNRTWRERAGADAISLGQLLAYLNAVMPGDHEFQEEHLPTANGHSPKQRATVKPRRVVDRPDVRQLMLFSNGDSA